MTTAQQPPAELAVPKFIKVSQILPGGHGYNTYVKVISVDTAPSDAYRVSCVVADETASARASFIDKAKDLIKLGQVLAIRNGKADVIKQQIQLRIDVFGRLTKETVNIDAVDKPSISDKKWEKQFPQRGRGGRGRNNRYGNNRGDERPRGQGRRGYDRDNRRDYRDNREGGRRYDNRRDYDRRDRDRDRDYDRGYDRGYDRDNERKYRDRDNDRRRDDRERDTRRDRGYGGERRDRNYERRDRDYDRDYDRRDNRDNRREDRGGERRNDYTRRTYRPTREEQREER